VTALPPRSAYNFNPLRFCVFPAISEEERRRRIAAVAYFKSVAQGFDPGRDIENWLAAEIEVNDQLNRQFIAL
jgi:transcription initiation factor TFIIIB Brf1 subunit/transcription initiation factor TFIIB